MSNLTPEQKQVGMDNYYEALGVTRRDFLKGVALAGVTSGAGLGAMYFGYGDRLADPVRIGVIGTGDEGSVLIGSLNPNYVDVKAVCDIRPFSIHRAFHGDWSTPNTIEVRPGLMSVYGWQTRDEADQHVKVYQDYQELLKNPDIEAVIIALPLHLHASVAIAAMNAGKHVLTEKLMAYDIGSCKQMARVAKSQDMLLATGHQRHYSVLYDNAVHLLKWGLLGQIHHIRAQWHRGNLPGNDSWKQALPGGELMANGKVKDTILEELRELEEKTKSTKLPPSEVGTLEKRLAMYRAWNADRDLKAEDYGYQQIALSDGRVRTAMEELCRWRLWDRTGGGLMAELGSHQLDAATIFISALRGDGKKAHPLSVHAVGGRYIFPSDREAEDHVYCMYEFPGPEYEAEFPVGYKDPVNLLPDPEKGIPGYDQDPNKKVVVTYSSINGNGFGGYGEVVMGTKGTMVIAREQEVMLYAGSDTSSSVAVNSSAKGGPTMDTQASGAAAAVSQAASSSGPVSRGYTEEIEHWAWCIRNKAPENRPRCHPEVALSDAVIALATNVALRQAGATTGGFVQFQDAWYDLHDDTTPDGSVVADEYSRLTKTTG